MIRFINILFITFLISCNNNKSNKYLNVNNEVWEITDKSNNTHSYSLNGQLIKTKKIDTIFYDGKVVLVNNSEIKYVYDDSNNLIKEITLKLDKDNSKKIIEERTYKYDNKRNKILDITFVDGFLWRSKENKYDQQNHKIYTKKIQQKFDTSSSQARIEDFIKKKKKKKEYMTTISTYEYNEIGQLIKSRFKETNIQSNNTNYSIYDENGKLINKVLINDEGDTINITTNEYLEDFQTYSIDVNSAGDTVMVMSFAKQKDTTIETIYSELGIDTYWYYSNNILKKTSFSKDRKRKSMTIYKYDQRGNQIEKISYK